jgi:hypothetical protein
MVSLVIHWKGISVVHLRECQLKPLFVVQNSAAIAHDQQNEIPHSSHECVGSQSTNRQRPISMLLRRIANNTTLCKEIELRGVFGVESLLRGTN